MPITMSGATVDTSSRDTLKGSSVDTELFSGGEQFNGDMVGGGLFSTGHFEASGAKLAGITGDFYEKFKESVDKYCEDISSTINELENIASNVAFQGGTVTAALGNFITAVKAVANGYIEQLKIAEEDIANSVRSAYISQDVDLGGGLRQDASTLESQAPRG